MESSVVAFMSFPKRSPAIFYSPRQLALPSQSRNWDQALSFSAIDSQHGLALDSSLLSTSYSQSALTGGLLVDSSATFLDPSNWDDFSSLQPTNSDAFTISHADTSGVPPFVPPSSFALTGPSGSPNVIAMNMSTKGSTQDTSMSKNIGQESFSSSGSSPPSPKNRSLSAERSSSSPKLSNKISSHSSESANRVEKRRQNTLAARRYRQKRVDQMSSLESTLKETQSERDDLRVRVARLEGEVETLRQLLRSNK